MAPSEEVQAWLDKGQADLNSARVLVNADPPLTDTTCFHCQQAAEKYLKAFLIHHNRPFGRIHNLVYLLELATEVDAGLDMLANAVALLTPYAIAVRYRGDWVEPSIAEAHEGLTAATTVVDTIKSRIDAN